MDEAIANFRLNIEEFEDEIFIAGANHECTPHLSAYSARRNLEIAVCYYDDGSYISIFAAVPTRPRASNGRFFTQPPMSKYMIDGFNPLYIRYLALAIAEEYRDFVGDPLPTEVTTHD